MQYYTIHISYYNSSIPISVGNLDQVRVLLKSTELIRKEIKKVLYVGVRQNYTAALYPAIQSQSDKRLTLQKINYNPVGNSWGEVSSDNLLGDSQIVTHDDTKQVRTYRTADDSKDEALDPGFYVLGVEYNPKTYPNAVV